MCKWLIRLFIIAYVVALALFVVGTFGLFAQPADPLSGIFLIPLGLPWNLMLGFLPDPLLPWVGMAAPLVNLLILRWLCAR